MPSWSEPIVEVIGVEVTGDGLLLALHLPIDLHPPLAPASLLRADEIVLTLDAVVEERPDVTVFRTRDAPTYALLGQSFGLRQWWMPEAFDAVTNTNRAWTLEAAPPPASHEHCLLGWETIAQGAPIDRAWRSSADWICPPCYLRYIVNDELRVRVEPLSPP